MAKFSVILTIEYTDNTRRTITTDASTWRRAGKGPFVRVGKWDTWSMKPLPEIEEYDARGEYEGWDMPGFDQSGWTAPQVW